MERLDQGETEPIPKAEWARGQPAGYPLRGRPSGGGAARHGKKSDVSDGAYPCGSRLPRTLQARTVSRGRSQQRGRASTPLVGRPTGATYGARGGSGERSSGDCCVAPDFQHSPALKPLLNADVDSKSRKTNTSEAKRPPPTDGVGELLAAALYHRHPLSPVKIPAIPADSGLKATSVKP
jgi:hypothetical protein